MTNAGVDGQLLDLSRLSRFLPSNYIIPPSDGNRIISVSHATLDVLGKDTAFTAYGKHLSDRCVWDTIRSHVTAERARVDRETFQSALLWFFIFFVAGFFFPPLWLGCVVVAVGVISMILG